MKPIKFLLLAGLMPVAFSCSNSEDAVQEQQEEWVYTEPYEAPEVTVVDKKVPLNPGEKDLVNMHEKFAFDIFAELVKDQSTENVTMSPLCASVGLTMALNGVNGESYSQLAEALGMGNISNDRANDIYYKLLNAMPQLDENSKISFANAIFMTSIIKPEPAFKERLSTVFGSPFFKMETTCMPADVARMINEWAKESTNSLIDNLISENEANEINFAFLNSLYFKAPWAKGKMKPTKRDFCCVDGTIKSTDFIYCYMPTEYAETDCMQAIALDFGSFYDKYNPYQMVFILPKEGVTVSEIVGNIAESGLNLNFTLSGMTYRLPKFEANTTVDLQGALWKLGVRDIFNPGKADFTRMTPLKPIWVNILKQKIVFGIDEEGATGASTSIMGGMASADINNLTRIQFNVDRPFLYFVQEKSTGAILFIGTVNRL